MFHPVAKKLDLDLSAAAAEGIADVPRVFHRHAVELENDVSGLKLEVLSQAAGLDANDLEPIIVRARPNSEALAKAGVGARRLGAHGGARPRGGA